MSDPETSRTWLVTHLGAREHYAVPRALNAQNKLGRFYTDIWMRHGRSLLGRLPGGFSSLAGRFHPSLPSDRVTAFNTGGIGRLVAAYRCTRIEQSYRDFVSTGAWFSRRVADSLARTELNSQSHASLLYTTCALEAMRHLRDRGIWCVVNQVDPGRAEEQIVLEEIKKFPGWQKQPGRIPDSYFQRLADEWRLADLIMVNSDWSKQAMIQQGVPAEKLRIIPQAYEPPASAKPVSPRSRSTGPVRVLWLGQVILRKGIAYLFQAARLLADEPIEFVVAGWIGVSEQAIRSAPPNVRLVGPVPRSQVPDYYRAADVFVLPTLSDGFAITQIEAMAHGVPVITTPRCGQVVSDGVDGLIVPPGDSQALAEAIASLCRDPDRLAEMGVAAVVKASHFSLERYAHQIAKLAERPGST